MVGFRKEACIFQMNGMVNMKPLYPQMTLMKNQQMEAYYTPNTEKVITSLQDMLSSVNFLRAFRAQVGVVWQKHNLVPRLSALTNVVHGVQSRAAGPRTWFQSLARADVRTVQLYCVNLSGIRAVRVAEEIDPAYAAGLREAKAAGVEVLAYGAELSPEGIALVCRLEVLG